jgi:hypothetical protein
MSGPLPSEVEKEVLRNLGVQRFTQRIISVVGILAFVASLAALAFTLMNQQTQTTKAKQDVQAAVTQLEHTIVTQCSFYSLIGDLPVPATTSAVGAELVTDSRNAYLGLSCPGSLTKPPAELTKLDQKYKIPLKG